MTNTYISLTDFLNAGILGVSDDSAETRSRLLSLIENVSRQIDGYCRRHFYVFVAEVYLSVGDMLNVDFNCSGDSPIAMSKYLWLPYDLTTVYSLSESPQLNGQYTKLWPRNDYYALPRGADLTARPYVAIEANWWRPQGPVCFRAGRYRYRLSGEWGYGWLKIDTGVTARPMNSTQNYMEVSDGAKIKIGGTYLLENEQVYVINVESNNCTIIRGVNRTIPRSHPEIDILQVDYPGEIKEACLMQTARLWTRRATGYGTAYVDVTQITSPDGLDKDVQELLRPFRKARTRVTVL